MNPQTSLRLQRHLILALAFIYTAFRNRKPLLSKLNAILAAIRRTAHAANVATLIMSRTSTDMLHYLQPSLPPPPRPLTRTRAANRATHAPVPRSIRRLLRLAASPDGLAILRGMAGGVGQGVVREMAAPSVHKDAATNTMGVFLATLASPQGMHVATTLVSTAVREAVTSAMHFQHARNRDETPLPELIMQRLVSDKGRALLVDLVSNVTRIVVPMLLRPDERDRPHVLSPVASPMRRKRPPSWKGADSPSKHIVMSMMRAQGSSGIVERLALLAIRDKALVRDVVRTVVGEAVRTYLTTKSELEGGADADTHGVDAGDADAGNDASCGQVQRNDREGEIGKSLWRLMIASVVTDLKRALIRRGEAESSPGWVVF